LPRPGLSSQSRKHSGLKWPIVEAITSLKNRLRDPELRIYACAANPADFPFKFKKLREPSPRRPRRDQCV